MGNATEFPIILDSEQGRELIADCCRFAEGILDERQVRKKYKLFDAGAWEALGSNDELVEKSRTRKLAE